MDAMTVCLELSRKYAMKAAKFADAGGKTYEHQIILSAISSLDDALHPDEPASPAVRELMERMPHE